MESFVIDGNVIDINRNKLTFEYDIDSVRCINDVYIVLVDIPSDVKEVNNIYAINNICEILWKIQDPSSVYGIINDVPYVGIRINEEGVLIATNFNGVTYSVDIKTGNIIGRGATK